MNSITAAYTFGLSPDKRTIASGNGVVQLTDRATGSTRQLCVGAWSGWSADSTEVGVSRGVGDPPGPYHREFYIVNVATGAERKLDIDITQDPGYHPQHAWQYGTLLSSIPGQQWRGGASLACEANADPIQCMAADAPDRYSWMFQLVGPWTAIIRGTDHADIRIEGGITQTRIDRIYGAPWVSANYAGMMFLRNGAGNTYQGPTGESRGLPFIWRGEACVITTVAEGTAENPVGVWIIRKLSDWTAHSSAFVIKGVDYVCMHVEIEGDILTVFGSNDGDGEARYGAFDLATATWAPYVPPMVIPPQPAPLPPSVIGTPRPAWIVDTESILPKPGNGISTSDGPGPVYFEDPLWTDAIDANVEAYYFGPEKPRRYNTPDEDYFTVAVDKASKRGAIVPITVNDEWGHVATVKWLERFTAQGCKAVWMVEAYRPADQSQDTYRAVLTSRLQAACAGGKDYAAIPPYYEQQAGGSEADSIHTLNIFREVLATMPHPPIVLDLFGLRRPPQSDARKADAKAWIAGTPIPVTLRQPIPVTPPAPVDPPKPPVVIVVPPAEPKPPKLTFWQKLLLLLKGRRR